MPEDLTPNTDELASTTVKTGPDATNAADSSSSDAEVRPSAEPRSKESLHDEAFRDTASNQDDETQGS